MSDIGEAGMGPWPLHGRYRTFSHAALLDSAVPIGLEPTRYLLLRAVGCPFVLSCFVLLPNRIPGGYAVHISRRILMLWLQSSRSDLAANISGVLIQ